MWCKRRMWCGLCARMGRTLTGRRACSCCGGASLCRVSSGCAAHHVRAQESSLRWSHQSVISRHSSVISQISISHQSSSVRALSKAQSLQSANRHVEHHNPHHKETPGQGNFRSVEDTLGLQKILQVQDPRPGRKHYRRPPGCSRYRYRAT